MKRWLAFAALLWWAGFPSFGGEQRVAWNTSRVLGSPEKPPKFKLERAVGGIAFTNPIDFAFSPELNRWFLGEQGGKVLTFDPGGGRLALAADFGPLQTRDGAFYALTFDPAFASNRFIYVCYALKSDLPDGSRVSRFKVTGGSEPKIDLGTEEIMITWLSGGHNGCCLKFGKDGMLYISTGDAAGPNPPDPLKTGQDISDLLSSILRIDVHQRDPGKNYAVPRDNPFIDLPRARPEIWAYGFRNPWRMGFDEKTGDLWVGDVGWELWELVFRVERGGNYGWSIVEGRQPVLPNDPRGPTPILPPIKDHPHHEAASITGGLVYYGSKFPELRGAFIYGDWETGKIWGLKANGNEVAWSEELTDSATRIIAFAPDAQGEIVVLDYTGGIYTLEANPAAHERSRFPLQLSETGLFSSLPDLKPAPGVLPYHVIAPMWRDFAHAERLLGLPDGSRVGISERPWKFPSNAVLAITYSLDLEQGQPTSRRRIETQILHQTGDGWGAYSYRWNDAQNDAELVSAEGTNAVFQVKDPAQAGGIRRQNWRFHSRAECLRCHNTWCGTALGFQPEQLGSAPAELADYFEGKVNAKVLTLVNPSDGQADLAARARSYLHANCSHCHRDNAGGAVRSVMNFDPPLDKTRMVNATPIFGDFGLEQGKVISAGQPFSSTLLFRVSTTGRSRMPYITSDWVDEEGVTLLRDWIASLGDAGSTPDESTAVRNTSEALRLAHALLVQPPAEREKIAREMTRSPNTLIRELFDRFLPADDQASKHLEALLPAEILARYGDAKRGAALLGDASRTSCLQCHTFEGTGRVFGPDLRASAAGKTRADILDSILFPSKQIAPEFVLYTLDLDDEPVSGVIAKQSKADFTLRDSAGQDHTFPAAKFQALRPQQLSAMPEGLLSGLNGQEVADLLEAIFAGTK